MCTNSEQAGIVVIIMKWYSSNKKINRCLEATKHVSALRQFFSAQYSGARPFTERYRRRLNRGIGIHPNPAFQTLNTTQQDTRQPRKLRPTRPPGHF
jgi:hypothetical protein